MAIAGIYHNGEGHYGIDNWCSLNLWIKHLVSALRYCHDRSLVHSDVKPANLLLLVICYFSVSFNVNQECVQ